jgi:hypothetical protein
MFGWRGDRSVRVGLSGRSLAREAKLGLDVAKQGEARPRFQPNYVPVKRLALLERSYFPKFKPLGTRPDHSETLFVVGRALNQDNVVALGCFGR